MLSLSSLRDSFLAGNVRAVAQAISLVEDDAERGAEFLSLLGNPTANPRIIGVTGPPGAGKSTLTAKIAQALLARGEKVALLLIDPSSPFSGGAILGDRIRMHDLSGREGVYIRSISTRGSLGGLSAATSRVLRLLQYCHFSSVIVETVGTGQAETDVVETVDAVVVVAVPGLGDDIQAIKAGIMEIADVFVVNKADRDGADRTKLQIEAMLGLQDGRQVHTPPVLTTVATSGKGIKEVVQALDEFFSHLERSGEILLRRQRRMRKEFSGYVGQLLLADFNKWKSSQAQVSISEHLAEDAEIYGLAKQLAFQYLRERMEGYAKKN